METICFFNLNTRTSPKQLLDGLDIKLNYSSQKILLLRISSVWVPSLMKQCSKRWKFNSMEATTHYECLIRFYPILSSSLSRLRICDSRFRCRSQLTRSPDVGLRILDSYLGSLRVLLKSQHSVTWKALSWLDICKIAFSGRVSVDSGFWKILIWFGFNKTLLPAGLVIEIRWTSVEKLSFGYFRRSSVLARDVTIYLQSTVGVVFSDWPPQPTCW